MPLKEGFFFPVPWNFYALGGPEKKTYRPGVFVGPNRLGIFSRARPLERKNRKKIGRIQQRVTALRLTISPYSMFSVTSPFFFLRNVWWMSQYSTFRRFESTLSNTHAIDPRNRTGNFPGEFSGGGNVTIACVFDRG